MSHPDGQAYSGADSGCPQASEVLGRQSRCLEPCPLPYCLQSEDQSKRDKAKLAQDVTLLQTGGMDAKIIAMIVGVSKRTIERILQRSKE